MSIRTRPQDWVADLDEPSLMVYAPRQGRYEPGTAEPGTARSPVLPGFVVDLEARFADQ